MDRLSPLHRPGPLQLALFAVAAITLWRLLLLATFPYGLYGDEAQYWGWAKALDWGYFSKPPLIGWQIWLTTSLCGDGIACIKLASPLQHAATAVLLALIARRLFDERAAAFVALVYLLMPGVSLAALVASTDTPLLLFWSAALYAFLRALDETRLRWWIVAGLAAGLGLLSKYNMLFFLVSVVVFLGWDERHRDQLRRPGLYLASLVAALVYLPNLLWNWANDFPSYRHTGDMAGAGGADLSFEPSGLLRFVGDQAGVFGPVAFLLLLYLLLRLRRHATTTGWRLAWALTLPWLLLMAALSSVSGTNANWSAPAYIGGSLLVAAWLAAGNRRYWLAALLGVNLLLTATAYHFDTAVRLLGVEISRSSEPFKFVRGWEAFGTELRETLQTQPPLPLIADDRMFTAQLIYQLRDTPFEVVRWNPSGAMLDYYAMTTTLDGREGEDFLLLLPAPSVQRAQQIGGWFEAVEPVAQIRIPIHVDLGRDYDLWLARGFHGYAK